MDQVKRVAPDLLLGLLLTAVFFSGAYRQLPEPLQLVGLKAVLVSLAFLHAHVVGKLAFPRVNWRLSEWRPGTVLRIVLYAVFIFAYSTGG